MGSRFMRLLVFFDLPTKTNIDKKVYTLFRKFLLKNGYIMLQFSVYARICKGQDSVVSNINCLQQFAPVRGNIRVMSVTEKQYASMGIIAGVKKKEEENAGKQLLLF